MTPAGRRIYSHVTGKSHSVTSPLTGGPSVHFQGHLHVTRKSYRGPSAFQLVEVPSNISGSIMSLPQATISM